MNVVRAFASHILNYTFVLLSPATVIMDTSSVYQVCVLDKAIMTSSPFFGSSKEKVVGIAVAGQARVSVRSRVQTISI